MGEDDRHAGKIDRNVVDEHRVGVFQLDACATRHARPDSGLAGVEQRRQSRFRNRLVQDIGAAIVREKALHRGMKLEAANAEVADEPPSSLAPALPFAGSMLAKGIRMSLFAAAFSATSSFGYRR